MKLHIKNPGIYIITWKQLSFSHSLPSLRPLMDVNYLPLTDMRIARTFCFTNGGQALYLSSPTEIQRITYSQEMCDNLQVRSVALFSSYPCKHASCQLFLYISLPPRMQVKITQLHWPCGYVIFWYLRSRHHYLRFLSGLRRKMSHLSCMAWPPPAWLRGVTRIYIFTGVFIFEKSPQHTSH